MPQPLALVGKRPLLLEGLAVVDEAALMLPRELQQLIANQRQSLRELLVGDFHLLQHPAGGNLHAPQKCRRW